MAFLFFSILIGWAMLGIWSSRTNRDYFALGTAAIIWILFLIVGLKVFGWPG